MRQGRKDKGRRRCRHSKSMYRYIGGKKLCIVCDSPEIANKETNYIQYSDLFKGEYKYE